MTRRDPAARRGAVSAQAEASAAESRQAARFLAEGLRSDFEARADEAADEAWDRLGSAGLLCVRQRLWIELYALGEAIEVLNVLAERMAAEEASSRERLALAVGGTR